MSKISREAGAMASQHSLPKTFDTAMTSRYDVAGLLGADVNPTNTISTAAYPAVAPKV